jgi:tetratricopeptide (TPR) repeat protein
MRLGIFILFFFIGFVCAGQEGTTDKSRLGYYLTNALDLAKQFKHDDAIMMLDSAEIINNKKGFIYQLRAELLWMKNNFIAAAKDYQKAILLDSDSSFLFGAYLHLGILYEKAGLLDKAQSEYLRAVYFFENKTHKLQKYFEMSNNQDYTLSLLLSGKIVSMEKVVGNKTIKEWLKPYLGKTRESIIEIYFEPFSPKQ